MISAFLNGHLLSLELRPGRQMMFDMTNSSSMGDLKTDIKNEMPGCTIGVTSGG